MKISTLQILKTGIRQSYDYLGLVVGGSLGWFAVAVLSLYFGYSSFIRSGNGIAVNPTHLGLWLLTMPGLVAPVTAGNFAAARKIAGKDDPSPMDLLAGFTRLFLPSAGLMLLDLFIAAVVIADLVFFSHYFMALAGPVRFFFLVMLVITTYAGVLWTISTIYHWPLLVEQGGGVLKVQKKAVLLALDNPIFTFLMAIAIMLLAVLLIYLRAGAALLMTGMIAIIESNALLALLRKYGIEEEKS